MATPSRKRPRPVDVDSIAEITTPTTVANVHGFVTSISPIIPTSKKPYFEGYLDDGTKRMRFVGFNPSKEKIIDQFSKSQEPVLLSSCRIVNSKFGEGLDIMLNDNTVITKSDKNITSKEVTFNSTSTTKELTIEEVKHQLPFQRVTVKAKVVDIGDSSSLFDGRTVQNIVIADITASIRISLWQEFVNTVTLGKSYKFTNVTVKAFDGMNTLFTPKQEATIELIEDLEGIQVQSPTSKSLKSARIVAVNSLVSKRSCVACNKGEILSEEDPLIGRCSNCSALVLIDDCPNEMLANLTIKSLISLQLPVNT